MSGTQPAVLQNVAIGVEETPGVLVPVTHRLGALGIDPAIQVNTENYGPVGMKADTMVILNQEWVQAGLSGKPTYNEIIYPLSSIIGKTTPTQVEVETDDDETPTTETVDAWDWVFEDDVFDIADPATFTVHQNGRPGSGYAQRFGYGLLTDFGINIGRTAVDLTGTMVGQAFDTSVAPFDPETVTMLDLIPILSDQMSVYFDGSAANLGVTQHLHAYTASFSIGQRYSPDWPLRHDLPSFGGHIDLKPAITLQIQMQRDAIGMSPLAGLRNGDKSFIRVEALGPVLDTYTFTPAVGDPEEREVRARFWIDFAGIGSAPSEGELGGNRTITWTFVSVFDQTWGKAYSLAARNGVAALTAP